MTLKFKNYYPFLKLFVLSVTFIGFIQCGKTSYKVTHIEAERIGVSNEVGEAESIHNFIEPYKKHIDKDLDSILSYNPETLEKSKGKWQTNIGDWMAYVCFQHAEPLFYTRTGKHLDLCLLNHGGIRAILPKGNVNARNAYEIMPFENNLVVIGLTHEKMQELITHFIHDKKPHPLYGMSLKLNKDEMFLEAKINEKLLENDKIYYVLTSDYLASGGDNMSFFIDPVENYDLDYKIRNVLIDEFKRRDTLWIPNQKKVFEE